MKNNSDELKNFAGIFPNVASKEYCDKVIHRYEYLQKIQLNGLPFKRKDGKEGHLGRGKIWSRQEGENSPSSEKENDTYFLGGSNGDNLPLTKEEKILMGTDAPLFEEFGELIRKCYEKYTKKYGFITSLGNHIAIAPSIRIQKYRPGQGYHIWHCDNSSTYTTRRMIVIALYLNTVEEGGETEFLHQGIRVAPVRGTMTMWPAGWTHAHRGNPPLKEDKYLMTTWLEYVEHQHNN